MIYRMAGRVTLATDPPPPDLPLQLLEMQFGSIYLQLQVKNLEAFIYS